MRILEQRRGYFRGAHKGCEIEIERDREHPAQAFYITVRASDGGHLYNGWAPDNVRTIAAALGFLRLLLEAQAGGAGMIAGALPQVRVDHLGDVERAVLSCLAQASAPMSFGRLADNLPTFTRAVIEAACRLLTARGLATFARARCEDGEGCYSGYTATRLGRAIAEPRP